MRRTIETPHKYKMIFSDIDGTLLDSSHQVPEETRQEILKLEREGVPFILVSARMPDAMTTIQDQIGNRAPMVCYSGALIRDERGENLYSCQMDLGVAMEIKELLDREYPRICCNTYGGSRWVVDDDKNPWVMKEEAITGRKAERGDMKVVFTAGQGIHKFLLMGDHEEIERLEGCLKRKYPRLSIATSSPVYMEVMDGKVKKSEGVRFLCSYFGVGMDEVIALGDGCNDMDMLQAVHNSYAMANACEEVKRSAAHVTLDNDRQGLLAVLKENFR